jgi:non-specific serine/threonine protein kinase
MQRAASLPALAIAALVLGACAPAAPTAVPDPQASEPQASEPTASEPTASEPTASALPAWTEVADAPLARLEMATAAHDGRIWLAGGLSPLGEAVAEVEVFDPDSGEWASGPSLPTGLHHAALVSDGDRLLLIGGYIGATFGQPTDIVLVLADEADSWEPGPSLPDPRAAGAAAWDGTRVVYAGGVGPGGVSGDVFALTDGAWDRIGAMSRAREHLAAASDGDGRTWLLGGRVGGLDSNLGDADLVEGTEITALAALPTARGGVGAFFLPELGACLTGGEAPTGAFTTVECIDAAGEVTTGPDMIIERHGHGAAVVDGAAYVLLGGPVPGLSAHASVERLDPAP